ncbi:hypothetical protein Ntsu_66170 [Nocardia sp. IFM 10818]
MLSGRPDGLVVRVGHLVVKSHPADTDPAALTTRLHLASHPLLHEILVPPIPFDGDLLVPRAGRLLSLWPYGASIDPADPEAVPWQLAASLLARLHQISLADLRGDLRAPTEAGDVVTAADHSVPATGGPLAKAADRPGPASQGGGRSIANRPDSPAAVSDSTARAPDLPCSRPPGDQALSAGYGANSRSSQGGGRSPDIPAAGGPARVRRALERLRAAGEAADSAAAEVVWQAYATVPELGSYAGEGGKATLVHGDFHLGQLVRLSGAGENPWRLIDVDDLGVGDPVWDLARFAGYFAAAILDPVAWERFLTAYRQAGGPAVPEGDPWPVLDVPARALVIQATASAVAKAGLESRELDEWDVALLDSCRRMRSAVS